MKEKVLQTLEFTKVRERMARYAATEMGHAIAEKLRPLADPEEIAALQQETREAAVLISEGAPVSMDGVSDIRPLVQRATKGGMLEPREFLAITLTTAAARRLRQNILGRKQRAPALAQIAEEMQDTRKLEEEIGKTIGVDVRVRDDASIVLKVQRDSLRAVHEDIVSALNGILAAPNSQEALQEPVITQRGGRFVLPVRSDRRTAVQGIVHDVSASGATLFVEPMQVVDLGNEQRELQAQERREIERILTKLSREVALNARALNTMVRVLARLDVAFAKGQYARATHAVEPHMNPAGEAPSIRLVDARHPLLGDDAVPMSLEIGGQHNVMVITGPNTGGKTVALKTVGLLILMHQAGLHIPAGHGSHLSVFRHVFADIGDEQSIEQSLSTFSSHMTVIVETLREANKESLVLLDELGAGTDPDEGAALAEAILSYLLKRGILTIANSHHGSLKAFAHSTPGVRNASVEFDPESLEPTYRLLMDIPGQSNALVIAKRLGLKDEVLHEARGHLGESRVKLDQLLLQVQADRQASRADREAAGMALAEADRLRAEMELRLAEATEEKARAKSAAQHELYQESKALQNRLRRIRASLDNRLVQPERAPDIQKELQDTLRELKQLQTPPPAPAPEPVAPESAGVRRIPRPGEPVHLEDFGVSGTLISGPDKDGYVEIQAGDVRMKVPWHRVERKEAKPSADKRAARDTAGLNIDTPYVPMEVSLRGMYAADAEALLDQTLHDAFIANRDMLRIVHGKGAGILRTMVHDLLRRHPLVESFQVAEQAEGGDGVTVARLARRYG